MTEAEVMMIDAVIERPFVFKASGEIFYLYPITLGKMYLLQIILEQIGIKGDNLQKNINLEFLRVVNEHKENICELLSYMTARNDYYSVFDMAAFEKRKEVFMNLDDDEIASVFMIIMTADKTSTLIKENEIDKEIEDMHKVMKVKSQNDKNSYTFGGKTTYGSLIDVAMERYGMTKKQVVWEIDYTSLRMLLADHINSIYVTDDERKKIHISNDRNRVNGDDKEALIKAIQSQSWD